MLIGQFEGRIGNKHQAAFPKKFRLTLGNTLIITKGFETCLVVVSENSWKTLLEGTQGRPFTQKSTRETQRFLLGNATEVTLDEKGRFVIPEYLRRYAGIEDEIVFAGIERFVEIWNKKDWEEHQKNLSEDITSIAERLSAEENNG